MSLYCLDDYDYALPDTLIAQQPVQPRDQSRLLHLCAQTGQLTHRRFSDIIALLTPGDLLVVNDTRVIPARLLGHKASGGKVEVLILDYARGASEKKFECLVKASKRPKPGSRLVFEHGLSAQVLTVGETTCLLAFSAAGDFDRALAAGGHVPLPPYIQRHDTSQDRRTYQTVFAAHKGAVAAPTAGLHFTARLLKQLAQKGVRIVHLTLHVGYGTFMPVRAADIRTHAMHAEWFDLSPEAATAVNAAKAGAQRVVAVGTTCVRTLEYCAASNGRVAARRGWCDLFIYPGYDFKVVDAMITNFHLPKSTLLMLVSAFAGRQNILNAYAEAVRQGYRFYSYGDAMLIDSC